MKSEGTIFDVYSLFKEKMSSVIFLFDNINRQNNTTTATTSTATNHIDIDTDNIDDDAPDTPTRSHQDEENDENNTQHNLTHDDTSSSITTTSTTTPIKKATRNTATTTIIETCYHDKSNSVQKRSHLDSTTKGGKKPSAKTVTKKLFYVKLIVLLLEICLFNSFLMYETIHLIKYIATDYVVPWIQIQRWTKDKKISYCTYYGRKCYMSDKTANTPSELILDHTNITNNIVQYMNIHGATIIPNLLSEKTAQQLRSYILYKNQQLGKSISLMNMKHRWSFSLQVNDNNRDNDHNNSSTEQYDSSIVHIAMKELFDNKHLINGIEQLIGHDDPAIIELTAITAEYGAIQQQYHPDSEGHASGTLYTRSFIPSYSLFIPLQNISYNMGSTVIAPGTHMCDDGYPQGFPISGTTDNWPTGTGVLMNSQLQHYGSAYTDPTGPKRVIVIPTFTSRRLISKSTTNKLHTTRSSNNNHKRVVDSRIISHGTVYGIHWTQLGHTVSDWYKNNMNMTYRTLRSLQLLSNHPTYTSWSFWDQTINRIAIKDVDINIADVVQQYVPNTTFLHFLLFAKTSNTTTTTTTTKTSNTVVTIPDLDEYVEKEKGIVLIHFVLACITRLCHLCSLLTVTLVTAYVVSHYHLSTTRNRNNTSSVPKIQTRILSSLLKYRILTMYLILHVTYKYISWYYIDQSIWGINVRSKRSLNLPRTILQYPNTASTLPTKLDILLTNHVQSQYLGAYSKIIDMKHPGNVYWYNVLIPQYNTSSYYYSLSVQLQYDFCNTIITSLFKTEQRRILSLNRIGQWTVQTYNEAIRFCHTTFMTQSNHYVKHVVQQIDYLWTETQYGYFRDTMLHRTHIPMYLTQLRNRITKYTTRQQQQQQQRSVSSKIVTNRFQPKLSRFHSTIITPTTQRTVTNHVRSTHPLDTFSTSTSFAKVNEPFRLAWITVGNIVEILSTDEEENPFWYIGKVISVESYHTALNVQYMTGEKVYNIDRTNLRRFVQYKINEKVQVDIDNSYVYDDAIIIGFVFKSDTNNENQFVVYQGTRQKRSSMIKVYLVVAKAYYVVLPKDIRRVSIVTSTNEEST